MEKTVKIKCDCGHRFEVTKNDASRIDWDFSGPDFYEFECPNCSKTHFISQFSL